MKIKKIRMIGYKRFKDLTIELGEKPRKIIALIGPNGCGKSSIFDAMLFLANSYNPIGETGTKDYKYHSIDKAPNYDYRNVTIEFDGGDFRTIYNSRSSSGKQKTIFSFRSPYRYNNDLSVKESRAVEELRYNTYGASTTSSIDSKMENNYRRLKIKYDKYLHESDCKPSEAKQHIISELNNRICNCLSIEIDNLGSVEDDKGTIFFRKKDTPTSFEFNVLSSGEKEIVDIILDLYLRKDEYNDTIFVIDEPELHINSAIQKKLIIEINKLVGDNCQIWIATHSVGFMRALQSELKDITQIIQFDPNNQWGSKDYVLSPITNSRDKWKEIYATALDDLTNLVSPKVIVYCEGKAELGSHNVENGLDAKVYNTIFADEYPDVLFVSSGGNTELDQRSDIAIGILSKVFIDLKILVLKDRDIASGKITDERVRQQYLRTNPENHRVLKRYEIENYLYDSEVLKQYCSENGVAFDQTTYDKHIGNIVNDDVKRIVSVVKNICGIITSIDKDVFNVELAKRIKPTMSVYQELKAIIFSRA